MAARPDYLAEIVARRQLAGRDLPIHRRIGEARDAIAHLESSTRNWPAFVPRPSALDTAINQADAIARSLRELRGSLATEQGGPTNAA